ncbi:hypothetical protein QJS10_CPA16g00035 [Acorus calamus]|uniref:Uncharacterized protein n=1 Tax=Acorus calamus TaxID=4465 RepID=A0AAV9D0Q4_ACOCL|nr:hypothetical protein QJS10_CPA16g00035 [Acorus calamus]
MAKSCKGLAMELVKCLSESDCVKVSLQIFVNCFIRSRNGHTENVLGLRETYFNCKRGQVDMRTRIRENKGY